MFNPNITYPVAHQMNFDHASMYLYIVNIIQDDLNRKAIVALKQATSAT